MVNILIAEGFSCQRELVKNLKEADYLNKIKVFATHSTNRQEIFKYSDGYAVIKYSECQDEKEFIEKHLSLCESWKIDLLLVGKNTIKFEKYRILFEEKGIEFLNGAVGMENQLCLNNKLLFTANCQANNLPVVPAYEFNSSEEFESLYEEKLADYGMLAVKPASDVFAFGFFKLDPSVTLYKSLTTPYQTTPELFSKAYTELKEKPQYMLMPYYAGLECTVDIACCRGEVVQAIVRTKMSDGTQLIELEHQCIEIAQKFVAHFNCDGLIGIQFIQDENGNWLALEINTRPSGGFGYSMKAGCNLIAATVRFVFEKRAKQDQRYSVFLSSRKWVAQSAKIRPINTAEFLE